MVKLLLVNVNRTAPMRKTLYHAVRTIWGIDPKRAAKCDYILAERQGTVIGAFVADEWLPATKENFPECWETPIAPESILPGAKEGKKGFGFIGREAPPEIQARYRGQCFPRARGEQTPFRYKEAD